MFSNCFVIYFKKFNFLRRSNQSILKEINPGYSLEELKLKLHYFGHLMQRADSLEKTLMLGKIEGRRRKGRQRMRWLDGIIDSMDMKMSKLQEIVKDRETWHPWGLRELDMTSDWTTTTIFNWCKLNRKQFYSIWLQPR